MSDMKTKLIEFCTKHGVDGFPLKCATMISSDKDAQQAATLIRSTFQPDSEEFKAVNNIMKSGDYSSLKRRTEELEKENAALKAELAAPKAAKGDDTTALEAKVATLKSELVEAKKKLSNANQCGKRWRAKAQELEKKIKSSSTTPAPVTTPPNPPSAASVLTAGKPKPKAKTVRDLMMLDGEELPKELTPAPKTTKKQPTPDEKEAKKKAQAEKRKARRAELKQQRESTTKAKLDQDTDDDTAPLVKKPKTEAGKKIERRIVLSEDETTDEEAEKAKKLPAKVATALVDYSESGSCASDESEIDGPDDSTDKE